MRPPHMVENMFSHSLSGKPTEGMTGSLLDLPLNLIALIITQIKTTGDLARTCRTCRVLHYMTLPQLYNAVALRSYDHIRYSQDHGRPEGCGMASPFAMALNGLVSRSIAGNVKTFRVYGDWKDYGVEECARVGRVPDNDMMLSSLIRVAIEKMTALQSFSWELDTKLLPTVWQSLSQSSVTKLKIRFPSTRSPKPIALAPPLPNLISLTIYDIDPLCYADDVSILLLESKGLKELNTIWSPRMKEVHEPSISLSALFGRIQGSSYTMSLEKIGIANLYTFSNSDCGSIFDSSALREITIINSSGGGLDDDAAFLPSSWPTDDSRGVHRLKLFRCDMLSKLQCAFLGVITGLERIYLIDTRISKQRRLNGIDSPASSNGTPSSDCNSLSLKDGYIQAITKNHGDTLRHLLLPPQWRLNTDEIALIVRRCPNLEQLGIGVEFEQFSNLRLLVPFLPGLKAMRLLANPDNCTFADKMKELDAKGMHEQKIGTDPVLKDSSSLRYMGLGELIFKLGSDRPEPYIDEEGKHTYKRKVHRGSYEDVQDVAIWRLDSADIKY